MNLVFYSGGDNLINEDLDAAFISMLGKDSRITFIPASSYEAESDYEWFKRYFAKYGISKTVCVPVDRGQITAEMEDALESEAIYLSGGNTFYFLKTLRQSGALERIASWARNGSGVLAGMSAGSIIMTPKIDLAGLVPLESDPNDVGLEDLSSMSLVNFEVYPHFIWSEESQTYLGRYAANLEYPVYAFPDGAGVVISGERVDFVGRVVEFGSSL